jgi:acyl-CoA synthetase
VSEAFDQHLATAFDQHVAADGDAVALVVGDQPWTRAQIAELAARAAGSLQELGAAPGGAVIAHYDTSPEDLALAVAAARLGCTFFPIPKRTGAYELSYMLELVQPVLFSVHRDAAPADLAVPEATVVRPVDAVVLGPARDVPVHRGAASDIAVVGMTSGSTGYPKAVMHTWSALAWTADRMAALGSVRTGDAIAVTGAGAGAPGFTFFTYLGLTRGVRLVRSERWDPPRVLELMARHRCVWSTMVPTMLYMLLEAQRAAERPYDLGSMRSVSMGGAWIEPTLIQRARTELGIEVLRMYAMAECMANCSTLLSDPESDRDHMDGRPAPGDEVTVFDIARKPVPPGEVGELGLRGASLFSGYLGRPGEKDALMTDDGYFLSGDLGRITEDGYVKVVGRKKDMIIRGGFNIDPSEVEEMIRTHPAVLQVAVVGYPDDKYGERACAIVSTRPGHTLDHPALAHHLLSLGLSKEKLPERLVLCGGFPLSPDGKILKAALKARLAEDPTLVTL